MNYKSNEVLFTISVLLFLTAGCQTTTPAKDAQFVESSSECWWDAGEMYLRTYPISPPNTTDSWIVASETEPKCYLEIDTVKAAFLADHPSNYWKLIKSRKCKKMCPGEDISWDAVYNDDSAVPEDESEFEENIDDGTESPDESGDTAASSEQQSDAK